MNYHKYFIVILLKRKVEYNIKVVILLFSKLSFYLIIIQNDFILQQNKPSKNIPCAQRCFIIDTENIN